MLTDDRLVTMADYEAYMLNYNIPYHSISANENVVVIHHHKPKWWQLFLKMRIAKCKAHMEQQCLVGVMNYWKEYVPAYLPLQYRNSWLSEDYQRIADQIRDEGIILEWTDNGPTSGGVSLSYRFLYPTLCKASNISP